MLVALLYSPHAYSWPWDKVDLMDQKIDGSSEKAGQDWLAHFMKEASQDQQTEFGQALSPIPIVVLNKRPGQIPLPDSVIVKLSGDRKIKEGEPWNTLNGLTPNEVIKWSAVINKNMVALQAEMQASGVNAGRQSTSRDFDAGVTDSLQKSEDAGQTMRSGR